MRIHSSCWSVIGACLLLAPNVSPAQQAGGPAAAPIDLDTHPIGGFGLDLAARDPSVKPGDDFFMSVNGTWYAKAVIPPTFTAAGAWFELRIKSVWREQAILEAAAANKQASPRSVEGKIGAFYRAFMDEDRTEALGLTPLRPALDGIRSAATRGQLARLLGGIAGPGTIRAFNTVGPPPGRAVFSVDVVQDPDAPAKHAVFVGTPGILLPAPSFYVDPKLADIKQAYEAHVAKMLNLIEWPDAAERAKDIVAFETRVAEALTAEAARQGSGKAERATLAALTRTVPTFDWKAFLAGAELGSVSTVLLDSWDITTKVASIILGDPRARVAGTSRVRHGRHESAGDDEGHAPGGFRVPDPNAERKRGHAVAARQDCGTLARSEHGRGARRALRAAVFLAGRESAGDGDGRESARGDGCARGQGCLVECRN